MRKPSNIPFYLATLAVVAAVVAALVVAWSGPSEESRPSEATPDAPAPAPASAAASPARRKLLAALNPPRVHVENGSAAVLRLSDGYALVVPHKEGDADGTYKVYFSPSGNFRRDGKLVDQGEGRLTGREINVGGSHIRFGGLGFGFTEVQLGFSDSKTGIALFEGETPTADEVRQLQYSRGSGLDEEAVEQVFEEDTGIVMPD